MLALNGASMYIIGRTGLNIVIDELGAAAQWMEMRHRVMPSMKGRSDCCSRRMPTA